VLAFPSQAVFEVGWKFAFFFYIYKSNLIDTTYFFQNSSFNCARKRTQLLKYYFQYVRLTEATSRMVWKCFLQKSRC
jgi:hypothetical protein